MSLTFLKWILLVISLEFSLLQASGHAQHSRPANPMLKTIDEKMVFGTDFFPVPDIPQPMKGEVFDSPSFFQKIVRVTDKKTDGYEGPGIQNEYAKADPENANGTMVVLRGNDAHWYLYDMATWKLLRELKFPENNQEPEPRWDQKDPNVFYYLCNSELREYSVDRDESKTLHDFKQEFPDVRIITTGTEGDASLDRRYWCFMVLDGGSNFIGLVTYDRMDDKVLASKTDNFEDGINWVGMSMSGKQCIVGWENLDHPSVYSLDLQTSFPLSNGANGHGDLALDQHGADVLVYQNIKNDFICMSDLATGNETQLLAIPFDVNADIGMHVSGNCSATPGWALISTYGSKNPPDGSKHAWLDEQLFLLELKDHPRVWRLTHTHAYTSRDFSEEKNYFAECFATINTQGTRIWFGSNWETYDPDYSEAYLVQLPKDWYTQVQTCTPALQAAVASQPILEAFWPNPFHGPATIEYRLHRPDLVRIAIGDVLGRERAVLFEGRSASGSHSLSVDTGMLEPGIYWCTLRSGSGMATRKVMIGKK